MRGFGWFSDRELAQIALQTLIYIELPTIHASFGDLWQRCHPDAALSRMENLTTRFLSPSSATLAYCLPLSSVSVHTHQSLRPARVDPPHAKLSTTSTRTRSRRTATRN